VVVGEPQRAFYGGQFGSTFSLFTHYGVPLWVPEIGGAVDPDNEAHDLIMSMFGGVSKGERNRIRIRVRAAITAQARHEGRFLGGRPPCGYALADAGPHPNPAKAADGRRLHKLVIDEAAAAVIRRIFAEFLGGDGIGVIAARLNAERVACPSARDRQRNPHRDGRAWSARTIRSILGNPRYTGRQVWNRQRTDEVLLDVHDVTLGHVPRRRWNDPGAWVYSDHPAQPPDRRRRRLRPGPAAPGLQGHPGDAPAPAHAPPVPAAGAAVLRDLRPADGPAAGPTARRTTAAVRPAGTPRRQAGTRAASSCAKR
jgi:site-specific DNA recombinase